MLNKYEIRESVCVCVLIVCMVQASLIKQRTYTKTHVFRYTMLINIESKKKGGTSYTYANSETSTPQHSQKIGSI